jgi:hypothetical protein
MLFFAASTCTGSKPNPVHLPILLYISSYTRNFGIYSSNHHQNSLKTRAFDRARGTRHVGNFHHAWESQILAILIRYGWETQNFSAQAR